MKKITQILGCLLLIGMLSVSCDNTIDPWITEQVNAMKKSLPVMANENTRLDNVEAKPGNVMQYEYTLINSTAADSFKGLEKGIKQDIIMSLKSQPGSAELRDKKVTLVYIYKNAEGKHLAKIKVKPSEY